MPRPLFGDWRSRSQLKLDRRSGPDPICWPPPPSAQFRRSASPSPAPLCCPRLRPRGRSTRILSSPPASATRCQSTSPASGSRIDGDEFKPLGVAGTEAIEARSVGFSSTHLGAGRNKLFIRGIADSSFSGPTQSPVGQYFGDMRTGYSGPGPRPEAGRHEFHRAARRSPGNALWVGRARRHCPAEAQHADLRRVVRAAPPAVHRRPGMAIWATIFRQRSTPRSPTISR